MESKASNRSSFSNLTSTKLNPPAAESYVNEHTDSKEKETSQTVFLKQLVSRLNAELARCRNLGKIAGDPTPLSELLASGDALWLWDASTLSPLLHGQDEYIAELQKKIEEYEKHLPSLKTQYQAVITENERLHKQLEQQQYQRQQYMDQDAPHPSEMTSRFLSQQNQQMRNAMQQLRQELDLKSTALQEAKTKVIQHEKELNLCHDQLDHLESRLETSLCSLQRFESKNKELEHQQEQLQEMKEHWEQRAHCLESMLTELVSKHQHLMLDFQETWQTTQRWSEQAHQWSELQSLVHLYSEQLQPLLNTVHDQEEWQEQLNHLRSEKQELYMELEDLRHRYIETKTLLEKIMDTSVAKHEVVQFKAQMHSTLEGYKQSQTLVMEKEVKQRFQMERALRDKRMVESQLKKLQEEIKLDKERINMELAGLNNKFRNETKLTLQLKNDMEILQAKYDTESSHWNQEKQILLKDLEHQMKLVRRAFSDIDNLKSENQSLLNKLDESDKLYNALITNHQEEIRQLKFPYKSSSINSNLNPNPSIGTDAYRIPPVGV